MKNTPSYIILGLLISFQTNAAETAKDANKTVFSSPRPEIIFERPSVSGFSMGFNEEINVTHNSITESNREKDSKAKPKFREATLEEPLVVNDWVVTVGDDVKPLIPERVIKEIKKAEDIKKKKEAIFKENNLSKDNPVNFSEESYIADKEDSLPGFTLNNIEENFEGTSAKTSLSNDLNDGMGVIGNVPSLKLKNEDIIKDSNGVEGREKTEKKQTPKRNIGNNSSPWAIATVRGESSNKLAAIGKSEDFKKYFSANDTPKDNMSVNPWANNDRLRKNQLPSIPLSSFTSNQYSSYTPETKINQWAIRGIEIAEPKFTRGLVDTSFIRNSSDIDFMDTEVDFSNRWINEPKAVLINKVSLRPLKIDDNNLKSDEKIVLLAQAKTVSEKKSLLTKLEDDNTEREEQASSVSFKISEQNKEATKDTIDVLDTSHISLNEIRLNFKPNYADLSLPSIRLVSKFASRVANNKKSLIEIRMSDKIPYLQANRLTIVKQILKTNGISENQINPISTDRDVNTMILKFIPLYSEDKQSKKNNEDKIKKW